MILFAPWFVGKQPPRATERPATLRADRYFFFIVLVLVIYNIVIVFDPFFNSNLIWICDQ